MDFNKNPNIYAIDIVTEKQSLPTQQYLLYSFRIDK